MLVTLLFFSLCVPAGQYSNTQVTQLLKSSEVPDGVVFELVSRDQQTWQWATPMITSLRSQLLEKFPQLDIAVVSHGAEQFQLTKERADQQPEAIHSLRNLVSEGVNLHVCGTHSSWKNVSEDAYIDIVDVSASGPAQINDYINLGYTHIRLKKPSR